MSIRWPYYEERKDNKEAFEETFTKTLPLARQVKKLKRMEPVFGIIKSVMGFR